MTTKPFGGLPSGGSAIYVARPWRVAVRPLGAPSWMVPVMQSLHIGGWVVMAVVAAAVVVVLVLGVRFWGDKRWAEEGVVTLGAGVGYAYVPRVRCFRSFFFAMELRLRAWLWAILG